MASIESLLSVDIRKSFLSKSMNFFLTCCHTPYKNFVKELAGIERKLWVMSDMMQHKLVLCNEGSLQQRAWYLVCPFLGVTLRGLHLFTDMRMSIIKRLSVSKYLEAFFLKIVFSTFSTFLSKRNL